MRRLVTALSLLSALAGVFAFTLRVGAEELRIKLIVHPSRAGKITEADARAIYLKQKVFWDDGKSLIPINREAGSHAREEFSRRLFGQSSRRLAAYWNQRYFEAGEFPPATLASEEAVVRFVSENPEALGYVTAGDVSDVAVALSLD